jgi:protoheme IX farnesyltransferase
MINYYLLTKPGIILGNLITLAAGFLLASKGKIDLGLFLATLIGLAFIIASACVFNNFIDRPIDKKMQRTKTRPLVTGAISGKNAIVFAVILGIVGNVILYLYTNLLTVAVAGIGFFVYVVLYSLWKRHTIYGTAIGSIAGAIPPVVGYCAVSNRFDLGAVILFAILVLWQMPHFFSIALYHIDDYTAAQMPLLPIKRGALRTKIHMLIYILGFIAASVMLTLFHYMGYVYLAIVIALGLTWLALCLKGFKSSNDQVWGCQMFRLSLFIITIFSFVIPFDVV